MGEPLGLFQKINKVKLLNFWCIRKYIKKLFGLGYPLNTLKMNVLYPLPPCL